MLQHQRATASQIFMNYAVDIYGGLKLNPDCPLAPTFGQFLAASSSSVGCSVSWLIHKNSPLFGGHSFHPRRLKFGKEVECAFVFMQLAKSTDARYWNFCQYLMCQYFTTHLAVNQYQCQYVLYVYFFPAPNCRDY